jgi:hypothetical protein
MFYHLERWANLAFALMLSLLCASMLCATSAFAQRLLHVAEIAKITHSEPLTFGPVSTVAPVCSATTGGPGCKFFGFSDGGTGNIVEGEDSDGEFTWADTGTILANSSTLLPNGAHDASGNPTGFCAPFVATSHLVFGDSSTIDQDQQGIFCCASGAAPGSSCSTLLGPISIARTSMIITGGTGRFAGLTGGGSRTVMDNLFIDEQVWELPENSQ